MALGTLTPWSGRRMIRDRRQYAPTFPNSSGPPRPPDRGPLIPQPRSPVAGAAARKPVVAGGNPATAPAPDYLGQAGAEVQRQLDPILRQITQSYGARAQGITDAFGRITGQYAAALEPISGQTKAMYEQAKGPVSAAAAGINAQLTNQGAQSAATEQASTAAAQLPSSATDVDLAAQGKGSGGAAGAIGAAMIQALTTAQKAAMQYADQLPGFAKLQGEFETRKTLVSLAAQMADQLAQVTAQAPTLFYNIYNDLLDRAQRDKEFKAQIDEISYRRQQDLLDRQRQARIDRQQRMGIVAPNAPTVAGRTAYWQGQAERRTNQWGQVWEGTSTGMRPKDADPKKPGIQPVYTPAQASAMGKPVKVTLADGSIGTYDPITNTITRAAGDNPKKPVTPKKQPLVRYQDGQGRWHVYDPNTGETKTLPGPGKTQKGPKVDLDQSIARGVWVDESGTPIPRLKGVKVPKYKPGTAPSKKNSGGGQRSKTPKPGWVYNPTDGFYYPPSS